MNPIPENPSPAESSRRELTPEERALLPDFDDEARVGEPALASKTPLDAKATQGDGSALLGGAVCGCLGNLALGFVLLAFERAGLQIYGPGALAVVLGLILLFLLAREWPRRVMLGVAAFGISLLLSYFLLYLLVRPALNSFNPSALPDVPPDETGKALQVPQQSVPQQSGAGRS